MVTKITIIRLEVDNSDISFVTFFSDKKWLVQIMYQGIPQYPVVIDQNPIYEAKDARDKKIIKLLVRFGVDKRAAENLLFAAMTEAGKRIDEFELLSLGEPDDEVSMTDKYPEDIIIKANDILQHGDPFNFYLSKWKQCYAIINDDDTLGAMTICVIGSTLISNSKGLHEKVGGPSGYGKSAGITRMFALFPGGKTLVSSMSPKAAFYADLKPGTVIYCDDVDLSQKDLQTTIKQSTSDYQQSAKHTTVNKGDSVKLTIAPRTGWILSSVDNFDDEQMDTRFGGTEVSDSIEKQLAIFMKQADSEFEKASAGEPDEDVLVCRCMWDILQNDDLSEIRIPFAKAITWSDIKHPRSFPFFSDMIRCMTLFKIRQREKVGDFYVATMDDYNQAKEIYKKMEHINATKLNTKEIAILEYLSKQYHNIDNAVNLGRVSRIDLVEHLSKHYNMKQQNIIDIIHGKKDGDGGLLNKVSGLQTEQMVNNVFGGPSLRWYWYSGSLTKEGYADSIILNEKFAQSEIARWREVIL